MSQHTFPSRLFVSLCASFHVSNNSSVFRSKGRPTISPPLRIKLTDPEFETAAVLSTFIEMLRHGKVELPDEDKQPGRPALNLFRFLKKYECRVHLQLFCNWLKLKGDNRPLSAFIVAALVDDHAWCAKLLQSGPMGTWPTLKTTKKAPAKSLPNPANCPAFHEGQADMSLLDPNGAPAWLWRTLPDDYKFALGRSWSACSTWEEPKRGEYFEYYLLGYRNGEFLASAQALTCSRARQGQ